MLAEPRQKLQCSFYSKTTIADLTPYSSNSRSAKNGNKFISRWCEV